MLSSAISTVGNAPVVILLRLIQEYQQLQVERRQ
jgi:hypothetical protein